MNVCFIKLSKWQDDVSVGSLNRSIIEYAERKGNKVLTFVVIFAFLVLDIAYMMKLILGRDRSIIENAKRIFGVGYS